MNEETNFMDLLGSPACSLEHCLTVLNGEYSTNQKKEALSSIGRKRDKENKEILFKFTKHKNPEIVMQATRGLLVFKQDEDVIKLLNDLLQHSNDMIRDVAEIELNGRGHSKEKSNNEIPDYLKDVVVEGDVLEVLECVKDESIHFTFTSPPYYNARDYSIYANYNEYLDFLESVFTEVHRITKEGRFFILNTSPIIMPRVGRKYSSRRYALPFDIHARLANIGWEFIDDIIWSKPELSAKNRVSGFNVNRKPLTYKPNPCIEYLMVYRKKTHRLIDWNLKLYDLKTIEDSLVNDDFNRSNIWNIAPTASKKHSAVFPVELCRQVIKLYSLKNDLVFDPFAGSGTMGAAAIELDRKFFLTEISKVYFDVIVKRLTTYSMLENRFSSFRVESFREKVVEYDYNPPNNSKT
ncbi:MAG: DNA methyltransferase [Rhodobacteraceae bacterium]|nr:DNA methyltransferase [Paracoccaceae bacterium]